MNTILVTGGAGYIGSHTCKVLSERGLTPIVFDNLSRGHRDLVRWGPFIQGDILDPQALEMAFKKYSPSAVIHFAGLAYVGESFSEPLAYYRTNVSGMINLLDAMVRSDTKNIVFSSSCTTYGIPDALPISESAPQRPISPYGHSKFTGEQILKDAASSHGLRYAIFRYFNACGADASGTLVERHNPETHLIPLTIDAATGKGPPLSIFGSDYRTADGTCERDYIHVTDLATAHVDAIRYLEENKPSTEINLGSGRAHSVKQIVAEVERVVGKPVPTKWAPRRPGDPPALFADPRLAKELLGFTVQHSDLETIIKTAWKSRS